jgi:hypothetical protein
MHKQSFCVLLAVAVTAPMTGCMTGNSVRFHLPTVGQELTDLEAAREKGALSNEEYNEQRLAILKRGRDQGDQDVQALAADPRWNMKFW